MHFKSMSSPIIMSAINRARGMSCSFLQSATTQHVQARFGIANGLGASSNTMSVKPHEFFDHTGKKSRNIIRNQKVHDNAPAGPSSV